MRDLLAAPHRPAALRLWTAAKHPRPPEPPLGLRAWSPAAEGLAVWLMVTASPRAVTPGDVAAIAAQLPDPDDLRPDTPVLVLGSAAPAWRSWLPWVDGRRAPIPRALRCSALLVRGYVDLGAGGTDDLAWGWSPERRVR